MTSHARKALFGALGMTVYILLGAKMFLTVEQRHDEDRRTSLRLLETRIKSKYNISARDFGELVKGVQAARPEWTWLKALGLTLSIVTTIGKLRGPRLYRVPFFSRPQ